MQTFLPYPSFTESARCLDSKRLGKQRVEVLQLLNALSGKSKGWGNHPCTKMWRGYEDALKNYGIICCQEWVNRGYRNNIAFGMTAPADNPPWLGNQEFHDSHKSNLLRKFPEYYSRYKWKDSEGKPLSHDLPYVWPV